MQPKIDDVEENMAKPLEQASSRGKEAHHERELEQLELATMMMAEMDAGSYEKGVPIYVLFDERNKDLGHVEATWRDVVELMVGKADEEFKKFSARHFLQQPPRERRAKREQHVMISSVSVACAM